jgi:hypothetical protein
MQIHLIQEHQNRCLNNTTLLKLKKTPKLTNQFQNYPKKLDSSANQNINTS